VTTQTLPGLSTQAQLGTLFAMNHALLTQNLEGVDERLAHLRPGEGNAIAWSLGHIVYWRQAVIGMLGGTPVWGDGEAEGFKGVSRDRPATIDKGWPELLDAYEESQSRLTQALDAGALPDPDALLGISQLQCHEAYHVGQIAMARRVAGLPGVV